MPGVGNALTKAANRNSHSRRGITRSARLVNVAVARGFCRFCRRLSQNPWPIRSWSGQLEVRIPRGSQAILRLKLAPFADDGQNSTKKWPPRVYAGVGDRRMYAFLLVLGSVITAAGLALVASGVSIQAHTFDASNVTPGTIAIIGGAILVGLAFVVRALLRVEHALMARPMPRAARPGEAAGTGVTTAQPSEQTLIPFPAKPKSAPQSTAVGATPPEGLRPPSLEPEKASVVEESDASLLPNRPMRSEEDSREVHHGMAARGNGAAAPQVAVSGRPARQVQPQAKGSIFDSLWPKAQRGLPEVKAAPAASAATPPPLPASEQTEPAGEPAPPPTPAPAPRPPPTGVSILKSGVVEGMAYTLYSDGSIEAQLPGGTLRFGSITELRNHIEQNG